jgi:heme/copper-type cytochrome/quinol oxidase subunit 2
MANDLELDDRAEQLQARETAHDVPVGIWALFGGLIAWGVYYFVAYIGWDQTGDLSGQSTSLGTNVAHTVAYTAIPAAVIVALAVAMARRTRARKKSR